MFKKAWANGLKTIGFKTTAGLNLRLCCDGGFIRFCGFRKSGASKNVC